MQRETRYVCGHLAVSCMERQNQFVTVWTHSISYVKACTPKLITKLSSKSVILFLFLQFEV